MFKHTALGISFVTWSKLLVKNRFDIGFPFLLKAIFITLFSFLNIPFQIFEYVLFNSRIKSIKPNAPIFIIGHPRSGTTYLHYLLSKDSQFAFCSTNDALVPWVMLTAGKITVKILDKFMPATRPQDNIKAGAKLPKEEEFAMANICSNSFAHGFYFPKHFKNIVDESVLFNESNSGSKRKWKSKFYYFIQKLTFKNKGKQLILKSPANTGRLKEILELFPNAKFIHIHRNPYEVYQSNEGLYEKILPLLSFHKIDNQQMEDFIIYAYESIYKKFLAEKDGLSDAQIFEVSYDAFISAPLEQLERAYQQLGITNYAQALLAFEEEINITKDYEPNVHLKLSKEKIELINKHWKFMFDAYGYKTLS